MTSIRWAVDDKKARRERIAIAAMQGMLAAESGDTHDAFEDMAMYAVNMADALIAKLDEQDGDE